MASKLSRPSSLSTVAIARNQPGAGSAHIEREGESKRDSSGLSEAKAAAREILAGGEACDAFIKMTRYLPLKPTKGMPLVTYLVLNLMKISKQVIGGGKEKRDRLDSFLELIDRVIQGSFIDGSFKEYKDDLDSYSKDLDKRGQVMLSLAVQQVITLSLHPASKELVFDGILLEKMEAVVTEDLTQFYRDGLTSCSDYFILVLKDSRELEEAQREAKFGEDPKGVGDISRACALAAGEMAGQEIPEDVLNMLGELASLSIMQSQGGNEDQIDKQIEKISGGNSQDREALQTVLAINKVANGFSQSLATGLVPQLEGAMRESGATDALMDALKPGANLARNQRRYRLSRRSAQRIEDIRMGQMLGFTPDNVKSGGKEEENARTFMKHIESAGFTNTHAELCEIGLLNLHRALEEEQSIGELKRILVQMHHLVVMHHQHMSHLKVGTSSHTELQLINGNIRVLKNLMALFFPLLTRLKTNSKRELPPLFTLGVCSHAKKKVQKKKKRAKLTPIPTLADYSVPALVFGLNQLATHFLDASESRGDLKGIGYCLKQVAQAISCWSTPVDLGELQGLALTQVIMAMEKAHIFALAHHASAKRVPYLEGEVEEARQSLQEAKANLDSYQVPEDEASRRPLLEHRHKRAQKELKELREELKRAQALLPVTSIGRTSLAVAEDLALSTTFTSRERGLLRRFEGVGTGIDMRDLPLTDESLAEEIREEASSREVANLLFYNKYEGAPVVQPNAHRWAKRGEVEQIFKVCKGKLTHICKLTGIKLPNINWSLDSSLESSGLERASGASGAKASGSESKENVSEDDREARVDRSAGRENRGADSQVGSASGASGAGAGSSEGKENVSEDNRGARVDRSAGRENRRADSQVGSASGAGGAGAGALARKEAEAAQPLSAKVASLSTLACSSFAPKVYVKDIKEHMSHYHKVKDLISTEMDLALLPTLAGLVIDEVHEALYKVISIFYYASSGHFPLESTSLEGLIETSGLPFSIKNEALTRVYRFLDTDPYIPLNIPQELDGSTAHSLRYIAWQLFECRSPLAKGLRVKVGELPLDKSSLGLVVDKLSELVQDADQEIARIIEHIK